MTKAELIAELERLKEKSSAKLEMQPILKIKSVLWEKRAAIAECTAYTVALALAKQLDETK